MNTLPTEIQNGPNPEWNPVYLRNVKLEDDHLRHQYKLMFHYFNEMSALYLLLKEAVDANGNAEAINTDFNSRVDAWKLDWKEPS